MRKFPMILVLILTLTVAMAGCRRNVPADDDGSITTSPTTMPATATTVPRQTQPSTQPTANVAPLGSTTVLEKIWGQFGENEKFSVYGGTVENAVMDAPGPLNMENAEELTTTYLIPQDQLANVTEASSVVHMMNSNIFTAVAVKTAAGADRQALSESWRNAIQRNQWICGQPDRMLMADVDGEHLLMAFGSNDAMTLFESKLSAVYADSKVLYNEAIVS